MPGSILSMFNYTVSFNPHNIPVGRTSATVFSILKMKKLRLREGKRLS